MTLARNFSGMDFDVTIGDTMVHFESVSLSITDNGAVALTGGIPNGYVTGSFSAEGQLVVDTVNAKLLNNLAKAAGSYQTLPPFDVVFFAGDNEYQEKIEVFGVKLKITELLNLEAAGGSKVTKTLQMVVTSPDFIKVDGVPIIDPALTEKMQA